MRLELQIITVFLLLGFIQVEAQNYTEGKTPKRILLSVTEKPFNSMAVSWRTVNKISRPEIRIAEAPNWSEMDSSYRSISVKSNLFKTDMKFEVFQHSAIMDSLEPNTQYVYKVGGDSVWSEWFQFRTAKEGNAPFEFTYFGDIQHDVKEFGSRLLRKSWGISPNSAFRLYLGDVVDRAEFDYLWDEFFTATGFIPAMVPSVFVAGNHEYADTTINGVEYEFLVELWRAQINQPKSTIPGLDETVFYVDYQGVRLVVLNGNEKLQEQAIWLEDVLKINSNKWTIIAVHQPVYSMSKGRDQQKIKEAFLPLIDKYHVDLVLQGHDHVYARTAKLYQDKKVGNSKRGTVYVTSNSGTDEYKLISKNSILTEKWSNKLQLFQVIKVNKNKLDFKTYTVTGELYDFFEITK